MQCGGHFFFVWKKKIINAITFEEEHACCSNLKKHIRDGPWTLQRGGPGLLSLGHLLLAVSYFPIILLRGKLQLILLLHCDRWFFF